MAELGLRLTERINQQPFVNRRGRVQIKRHYRPVGSVIHCKSDRDIAWTWLQICCGLPKRKEAWDDPAYNKIPGWKRICEAWTPQLWEEWFESDRPSPGYNLGKLITDYDYPKKMWDKIIPHGLHADIGLAPESDRMAYECFPWSDSYRKRRFVISVDDVSHTEVESWSGVEHRDLESGLLLSDVRAEIQTDIIGVWKRHVNFREELGISGSTQGNIDNPNRVCHPRHDKPVLKGLIKKSSVLAYKAKVN